MKYVSCTSRHFAAAFNSSTFQKGAFYTLAGAHLALQYFQYSPLTVLLLICSDPYGHCCPAGCSPTPLLTPGSPCPPAPLARAPWHHVTTQGPVSFHVAAMGPRGLGVPLDPQP